MDTTHKLDEVAAPEMTAQAFTCTGAESRRTSRLGTVLSAT
jgi:hypothetical protein